MKGEYSVACCEVIIGRSQTQRRESCGEGEGEGHASFVASISKATLSMLLDSYIGTDNH